MKRSRFSEERFRIFAVVDDYSRECVRLIADTSISGARVERELNAAVFERMARRIQSGHQRPHPNSPMAKNVWRRYLRGMIKRLILAAFLALAGCNAPALPGAVLVQHPDDPAANIEYFVQRPTGDGPWPTVIFLHGHQPDLQSAGGRAFVDWGVLSRFADEGYLAVAISLPGYGNSTGPRDFAGPYTQNAVLAVLEQLENEKQAMPDRIAIQGTSLGAVTAALIGAQEHDLAGLVLISGLYDLSAFFEQRDSFAAKSIRATAIAQTSGDADALRSRTALYVAGKIKAKTLILNGALDERTDPSQAVSLAQRINAAGGNATAQIFPNAGHQIPLVDRDERIHAFIEAVLNPESAADTAKDSQK